MKKITKMLSALCALGVLAAGFGGCDSKKNEVPTLDSEPVSFSAANEEQLKSLTDNKTSTFCELSKGESVELDFGSEQTFDEVVLMENGDNLNRFSIYAHTGDKWEKIYEGDRILQYRLCYTGKVTADKIRITAEDSVNPVKISEAQVLMSSRCERDIKVSQYLCFDSGFDEKAAKTDDSFSGYYNVVTDAIIIGSVFLDEQGHITFPDGEDKFAQRMEAFRKITQGKDVRIWVTVGFDRNDSEGKRNHDLTAAFVNDKIDEIVKSLKAFTEKYGVYGVDYDWEYPEKSSQWKAYSKIITESAEVTKVSVALPPWGIKLSGRAVDALEHVNVMAYDLFDNRGDHANSYSAGWGAIKNVMNAGIPAEKILLGVPSYGRTADKSADAWPNYRDHDLGKWGNLIKDYPYTTADGEKKTCDAYVNSYGQVRDKTALSISAGAGGIMIFRDACDRDYTDTYSLHRAAEEVIKNMAE